MSRHPRGGAVAAWHSNKGKENAPAGMLDTLKASLDGKAGSATDAHETLLLASLRRRRSTETETAPTHAFPNVDASKLRDRELPAAAVAALRAWARGDLPGDHAALVVDANFERRASAATPLALAGDLPRLGAAPWLAAVFAEGAAALLDAAVGVCAEDAHLEPTAAAASLTAEQINCALDRLALTAPGGVAPRDWRLSALSASPRSVPPRRDPLLVSF